MKDSADEIGLEDMLDMNEEEYSKLFVEYEEYKKERKEFQEKAFLTLPENPPLVLDCIHFLRVNGGLNQEGIFRVNGDGEVVQNIRKQFIENTDLNDILLSLQQRKKIKNFDVATALKSYFRLLKDPLVPKTNYEKMKDAADVSDQDTLIKVIKEEIQKMPSPNKEVFAFIMMFFQDISDRAEQNKMGAKNLATCLTMSIVRYKSPGDDPMSAILDVQLTTKVLTTMLQFVDYTQVISPSRYLEMLKKTSYRRELLPDSIEELKSHRLYQRFRKNL